MDLNDFYAALFMMIKERKIANAALTRGESYIKPFTDFNTVIDIVEFRKTNYYDGICIKLNGRKAYKHIAYLHEINGFKVNEKSLTVMLTNGKKLNFRF